MENNYLRHCSILCLLLFFIFNPNAGAHFLPKLAARLIVVTIVFMCAFLMGISSKK
jgi:hypothetical protein